MNDHEIAARAKRAEKVMDEVGYCVDAAYLIDFILHGSDDDNEFGGAND